MFVDGITASGTAVVWFSFSKKSLMYHHQSTIDSCMHSAILDCYLIIVFDEFGPFSVGPPLLPLEYRDHRDARLYVPLGTGERDILGMSIA